MTIYLLIRAMVESLSRNAEASSSFDPLLARIFCCLPLMTVSCDSQPYDKAIAEVNLPTAAQDEFGQKLNAIHAELANATVRLEFHKANVQCTGVVAKEPNLIFTAGHCVPDNKNELRIQHFQRRADGTSSFADFRMTPIEIKFVSRRFEEVPFVGSKTDVGCFVLQGDVHGVQNRLELTEDKHQSGDMVLINGLAEKSTNTRIGMWHGERNNSPQFELWYAGTEPGDSGAPVINTKGKLVGVVTGGRQAPGTFITTVMPIPSDFADECIAQARAVKAKN